MAVALPQLHELLIYTSRNLKEWKHVSEFGPVNAVGGVWECPSLFPLPLDGNKGNIKWVLVLGINPGGPAFIEGSGTQYVVGNFDGTTFSADGDSVYDASSANANWLDFGPDYYAAATYNGLDKYERIAITWMNDWAYATVIPTSPWRSAMSIPRKLTLEKIDGKSRLISNPTRNVQILERGPPLYTKRWPSTSNGTLTLPVSGKALDITLTLSAEQNTKQLGVAVRTDGMGNGTAIGYDFTIQQIFLNRNAAADDSCFSEFYKGVYHAPLKTRDGKVKLRILLDWSSVEVFGGHGEATITAQIFPADLNTGISLFSNGAAKDVEIMIEEVSSVWKTRPGRKSRTRLIVFPYVA